MSFRKKAPMLLLWLVSGVISWYVAAFLFSFVVSPFLARWVTIPGGMPLSEVALAIADMLIFSAGDYITAFFAAAILCYQTGYSRLWLFGFIIGANGYPLYLKMVQLFVYWNCYPKLPFSVIRSWMQTIAPTLIIGPFAAWIGCVVGRRLRLRRAA